MRLSSLIEDIDTSAAVSKKRKEPGNEVVSRGIRGLYDT